MAAEDFDIDELLRQPLVACIATTGPTVRPGWFLWEEGILWWLTGPWSALGAHLEADPQVAVSIDECDLATGTPLTCPSPGRPDEPLIENGHERRSTVTYPPSCDRSAQARVA